MNETMRFDEPIRDRLADIPTMSPTSALEYLHEVGSHWSGKGVAVECGSWLGATCAALAAGLVQAGYDRSIYCYDRWKATHREVAKAGRKVGLAIRRGDNLEPIFRTYVNPIYAKLETFRGKIEKARWVGEPIEVFLLDAAKHEPAFTRTLRIFGPSWIPGTTVVGFLDFYYYHKIRGWRQRMFRCQERFVEKHAGSFERLHEIGTNAFFRYTKPIAW